MSKVEVNQVTQQCGTTLTVGGGACKTAVVDATTVTLGRCGGTVSLASGATQSGFGRTGTVDWVTTPQTGTVTAATGKGYFVNTTAGAITVNLPAGAAGSIVAVSDYASTAASNNITVTPNGAELINAVNDDYIIRTAGLAVTLVYVDGTRGWKSVTGSDADATGLVPTYITATGGTPCSGAIVCTNYKVHTFTGPGTFCVSAGAGPLALADYLVIAGGGGGSYDRGGGGGAGGYRESSGAASGCYTASPLGGGVSASPVSVQGYPIVVGGGGPVGPSCGTKGSDSTALGLTSTGGGLGLNNKAATPTCGPGGSGGGGGKGPSVPNAGGAGNTPPVSPAQGFPGGTGLGTSGGAGGGGATVVGGNPLSPGTGKGGTGGTGATSSIDATPTARAGGGGGSSDDSPVAGGTGGGGTGYGGSPSPGQGGAGTVNTGGGGGGSRCQSTGTGGSGIVIIRYKFQ